jgi:predicted secreted protein
MTITAAIVLFSVTWFMVFFMVLPVRFKSQADMGEVVPGTPKSAPANADLPRKAKITTAIAVVLSLLIYGVIRSGWITVDNMDVFHIMR